MSTLQVVCHVRKQTMVCCCNIIDVMATIFDRPTVLVLAAKLLQQQPQASVSDCSRAWAFADWQLSTELIARQAPARVTLMISS